ELCPDHGLSLFRSGRQAVCVNTDSIIVIGPGYLGSDVLLCAVREYADGRVLQGAPERDDRADWQNSDLGEGRGRNRKDSAGELSLINGADGDRARLERGGQS